MFRGQADFVRHSHLAGFSALLAIFLSGPPAISEQVIRPGKVLLDEMWFDGSRAETNLPAESAIWVSRPDQVTVRQGVLSARTGERPQAIWTYFTSDVPLQLEVGETLTASIWFVLRGDVHDATTRGLRFGLFSSTGKAAR
jgi:hypothetical protein